MKQLRDNELSMVSGGGKYSTDAGLGLFFAGAAFLAIGILGFTPLKPGSVAWELLRVANVERHAISSSTILVNYDIVSEGCVYINRPIIPLHPMIANIFLSFGLGGIVGGITAFFGSN